MKLEEAKELIRVALRKAEELYAVSQRESDQVQWRSKIEVLKTVTRILDQITEDAGPPTGSVAQMDAPPLSSED